MSRKKPQASNKSQHPGSKKTERYIQPSILMALKSKPSYGYELIHEISRFGFVEGQAPPGMIYRHLRDLEANGLVASNWETDGTGPAKRVYQLTEEGSEILDFWISYMKKQVEKILNFVEMYKNIKKSSG
jgi:poly-beta-hydroxybutyrate-responsive repressor